MSNMTKFGLVVLVLASVMIPTHLVAGGQTEFTPEMVDSLRSQGEREGWTFTVGETSMIGTLLPTFDTIRPPEHISPLVVPVQVNRDLPEQFSWCDSGGCGPARDQNPCNSCWIFASVGVLESLIAIKDGVQVDLSEMHLFACTHATCDGGGWHAYDFFSLDTCQVYCRSGGEVAENCDMVGLAMESDVPYVNSYAADDVPGDCSVRRPYAVTTWHTITPDGVSPTVEETKQAIIDFGPVSADMRAGVAPFIAYTGGVYNYCPSAGFTDHFIVIVGWDDTLGSNGVWIGKNSWGEDWGEDGYFQIEYDCDIARTVGVAVYDSPLEPHLSCAGMIVDDAAGNGDGIAQPGEPDVRLDLTVRNQAADAGEVSVTVTCSDPEVGISDGQSSFGSVDQGADIEALDPVTVMISPEFAGDSVTFDLAFAASGYEDYWYGTVTIPVGPQYVGCCIGERGNVLTVPNCMTTSQMVDVTDLTNMISHLFMNYEPLCCIAEADVAPIGAEDGLVDVSDLTVLISYLFVTYESPGVCR